MTALQDALRELAWARKQHEIAKGYANAHQVQVEAMTAYKWLIEAKKQVSVLENAIGDAESRVRVLALAEHALTGEYKPAEGVQVNLFSKVVYEHEDAWAWCAEHALKYLVLETKGFEKAAPVLRDLGAPVQIEKEPRVSIATDLSAWLVGE